MKRIAIKLVVFLLLGAVVTVAVAWGCAAWLEVSGGERVTNWVDSSGRGLLVSWRNRQGLQRIAVYPWDDDVFSVQEFPRYDADLSLPQWSYILRLHEQTSRWPHEFTGEIAAGWPLVAVSCNAFVPIGQPLHNNSVSNGLRVNTFRDERFLPYRPIFPGFAINTAFYAVILWLLWSAPFFTRRVIRRRRGRCIQCGYDLRHVEHESCPECGGAQRDGKRP